MSSSSDVIDLERMAMAGGVSLFVCCGAAEGRQPNAGRMFTFLVQYTHTQSHRKQPLGSCVEVNMQAALSSRHEHAMEKKSGANLSFEQYPPARGF